MPLGDDTWTMEIQEISFNERDCQGLKLMDGLTLELVMKNLQRDWRT